MTNRIVEHRTDAGAVFVLTIGAQSVPVISRVLASLGREPTGRLLEALLVRISESGDPEWARLLEFDSEADYCVVYAPVRGPLVHLQRRLEKRLADPKRLRRVLSALIADESRD